MLRHASTLTEKSSIYRTRLFEKVTVYKLNTPVSEKDVRKLRVNDTIYINGPIVTVRDAAHRRALEHQSEGKKLPINFEGLAIFHCGPVVKKEKNEWRILAAGPTTSSRMNIFENEFIVFN